jgi:hypothetical protein
VEYENAFVGKMKLLMTLGGQHCHSLPNS